MSSVAERVATPPAADLVAFAKDVIAGRVPPPPIPVPPAVQAFLDRTYGTGPGQLEASPGYLRFAADRMSLDAIYQGTPVLVFLAPDESLSVLAVDMDEIRAVMSALAPDERRKVVYKCTYPT